MGSYLAVPCREVDEELGAGNGMEYGVGEMQVCILATGPWLHVKYMHAVIQYVSYLLSIYVIGIN